MPLDKCAAVEMNKAYADAWLKRDRNARLDPSYKFPPHKPAPYCPFLNNSPDLQMANIVQELSDVSIISHLAIPQTL
jgi:hypothetical protein